MSAKSEKKPEETRSEKERERERERERKAEERMGLDLNTVDAKCNGKPILRNWIIERNSLNAYNERCTSATQCCRYSQDLRSRTAIRRSMNSFNVKLASLRGLHGTPRQLSYTPPPHIEHWIRSRDWLLNDPSAPLTSIRLEHGASFDIVQDDRIDPYAGGNKCRKLDGLWPHLMSHQIEDVIVCGGLQSAYALAVASAAAASGVRGHVIFRGEAPSVPTGNQLLTRMLAHTCTYLKRKEWKNSEMVMHEYAKELMSWNNAARVAVLSEGGVDPLSLFGMIRLVYWLATSGAVDPESLVTIVIDSGTGTSAIGIALGIALMNLPWRVVGVMLTGPKEGKEEYYRQQARSLVTSVLDRNKELNLDGTEAILEQAEGILEWVDRKIPRTFGKVIPGEILECRAIAAKHGVIVDPLWTLAAFQLAEDLVTDSKENSERVLMIHTGGAMGLCGLGQRYPDEF